MNSDKPKHPGGRPTIFSEELADLICGRVACGESLNRITQDLDMPESRTVYYWLNSNSEFFHKYYRAKENQTTFMLEENMDIADSTQGCEDMVTVKSADLRIKTRQWSMERLAPKRFGQKVEAEIKFPDPIIITNSNGEQLCQLGVQESKTSQKT